MSLSEDEFIYGGIVNEVLELLGLKMIGCS